MELSQRDTDKSSKDKTSGSGEDDQAVNIADMVDSQVETYGDDEHIGFWAGLTRPKKIFLIVLGVFILGLIAFACYQAFGEPAAPREMDKRHLRLIKGNEAESRKLFLDTGKQKKNWTKFRYIFGNFANFVCILIFELFKFKFFYFYHICKM